MGYLEFIHRLISSRKEKSAQSDKQSRGARRIGETICQKDKTFLSERTAAGRHVTQKAISHQVKSSMDSATAKAIKKPKKRSQSVRLE